MSSILAIFIESLKCPYYLTAIVLLGIYVKEMIRDPGKGLYIRALITYILF